LEFVGFDWDDGNTAKCGKHGVSRQEIESVFMGAAFLLAPDEKHSGTEERFIAVARASRGRHLFVAFTTRPSNAGTRGHTHPTHQPAICTGRKRGSMSKRVPQFRTDEEAERFLEQDLTDYIDRDFMRPVRFELKPKNSAISLRLSEDLLREVKSAAKRAGVPYQKFIRNAVEEAVLRAKRAPR
jgi:predicted DNA binding CopG/RHH family protein/uncharacterized DUF497 family protein